MIPLVAYRDNSCDPRKCTVKKLERAGFLRIVKKISQIPRNTLLLDPTAEQALSPADKYRKIPYRPRLLLGSAGYRRGQLVEDPAGTSFPDGGKPGQFREALQAYLHRSPCRFSLHPRRTGKGGRDPRLRQLGYPVFGGQQGTAGVSTRRQKTAPKL